MGTVGRTLALAVAIIVTAVVVFGVVYDLTH